MKRQPRNCIKCTAIYTPTGNASRCGVCNGEYMREYRARRKAEGNPVHSGPHDPKAKQTYSREYYSRPGPRAARAAGQRRRYRNEPERQKFDARQQTKDAIRRGELLPQACEKCSAVKVDAHHDDYSKPLAVRWLCRKHHSAHHKAAKAAPLVCECGKRFSCCEHGNKSCAFHHPPAHHKAAKGDA